MDGLVKTRPNQTRTSRRVLAEGQHWSRSASEAEKMALRSQTQQLQYQNQQLQQHNYQLTQQLRKLQQDFNELQTGFTQLLQQNQELGESLIQEKQLTLKPPSELDSLSSDNPSNNLSPISLESEELPHPLEASILFDEILAPYPETPKKTQLQKLASEYHRMVYVLKKVGQVCTTYNHVLKVGQYLTLLLL